MSRHAQRLIDTGYPTAGGSADALTLTPLNVLTSYTSGMVYTFTAASTNTTNATLNISGVGIKAIRKISGGVDVALTAGDIAAASRYQVVYDSTANAAAGAWILTGSSGFNGTLTSTDAGAAAAPILTLYRDSATPATNDILGQVLFQGRDSATNNQEYAALQAQIESPTSTTESGVLVARTTRYGTAAARGYMDAVWRPSTAGTSIAVTAGQIFGLTLANNATDATNDINIAAGEAVDSTVSDLMVLPSSLIKRLDATWVVGTNQGMRASGAAIANSTYHIFLIKRPDTGVVDIAADTSASGANIAANTNVAYTLSRYIGSIIRESGAIVVFQDLGGGWFSRAPVQDRSSTAATASVLIALSVPDGVQCMPVTKITLNVGNTVTIESFYGSAATGSANTVVATYTTNTGAGSVVSSTMPTPMFMTNTSRQIYYAQTGTATSLNLSTSGWRINR